MLGRIDWINNRKNSTWKSVKDNKKNKEEKYHHCLLAQHWLQKQTMSLLDDSLFSINIFFMELCQTLLCPTIKKKNFFLPRKRRCATGNNIKTRPKRPMTAQLDSQSRAAPGNEDYNQIYYHQSRK